jgi:membrane associated rhomboid family serine protease
MIPIRDSNPTRYFPVVTVLFIVINVAVYLYEYALGENGGRVFIASYALVPERLFHASAAVHGPVPAGVTILTSMFLHGGFFHIAGNMLYLWIFGNNIEDAMGRARFVAFYLVCGAVAALGHALLNTRSTVPMIGASGAISGVLGAYLLLYPNARVMTLFILGFFVRMIEIPALVVLGFWFVFQILNAMVASGEGGGVAWFAHLGGFIAGMALIGFFKRKDVPFWSGRRLRYL